jgi:hypothetical protein
MHLRTRICYVRVESGGFWARMGGVRTECVVRRADWEGRAQRFLRLIALNCGYLRLFQIYIFLSLRTAKIVEGEGSEICLYAEVERDGKIYRVLPLVTAFCRVFGGMGGMG